MGRGINRLSGADLRRSKPGRYGDGGGLILQVTLAADGKTANRSWLFRWAKNKQEKVIGLGSLHTIPLVEARERARQCRQQILDGIDPKADRDRHRAEQEASTKRTLSFDEAARGYIAAKQSEWTNQKHAQQWPSTLNKYASPVIGQLPVNAIDTPLVMKVLQPIWTTIPETANRLRGRIEAVLDWATVAGHRTGDNPARWSGHLEHLLAAPAKLKGGKHLAAMPYDEVPSYMTKLRAETETAARALEFLVLTAARSGEVRGATWAEINLEKAEWTIPGARMKGGKDHRVPLSPRAIKVLRAQPRESDLVFFHRGGQLSDKAFAYVLDRLGHGDVTTHGFRSSFRTWAAEQTNFAWEVAEQCLSHTVGTAVERAYKRTDLFDQRRRLLEMWAEYCSRPVPTGATITKLARN